MRALLPAVLALLAACHGQPGVLCADGRICADGTTCEEATDQCIGGNQILACRGLVDGNACSIDARTTGLCADGVCRFPHCGDGVRNGIEACDGSDLGLLRCTTYGFYGGLLTCNATCDGVDVAQCVGSCGDGARNGAEVCDRGELGGLSCQSFGWHGGSLSCLPGCSTVDKSACDAYCGDGIVNGTELCDGNQQAGETCTSLGAVGGAMGCNAYCQPTTDLCQWGRWRALPAPDDFFSGVWASGPDDVWVASSVGVGHFDGATWRWQDLEPGSSYQAVAGSGPDDVWVASYDGALHHYDGTGWTATSLGPQVTVTSLWSAGPNDTWAVGSVVAHHDGQRWTIVEAPGAGWTRNLAAVWGSAPDDVWAVGARGLVIHYNGRQWTQVDVGTTSMLTGVRGTSASDVWIVGAEVALRRSGDGWQPVPGTPRRGFQDVWPALDGTTWLVSDDGPVDRHDGDGWHAVAVPTTERLFSLWRTESGDLWAAGSWGALIHQRGRGWASEPVSDPISSGAQTFITATGVPWAAHIDGAVWRYLDHRWQLMIDVNIGYLLDVWALDADNAIIVGEGGTIRRYAHGTWITEDLPTSRAVRSVWGTAVDDVWAVGDDGLIVHRDRDGWRPVASPVTETIYTVRGVARDQVWASASGTALRYDGTSWRELPFGHLVPLSLWASGPNDLWAVAGFGEVHRFDGRTWTEVDVGAGSDEVNEVWGSGPNDVWAIGRHGTAYHWDGATWSPSTTGVRSDLIAIGGSGASDVWMVAQDGAVLRRTDALPTAYGGACPAPAPISCGSRVVGAVVDQPSLALSGCPGLGGGQTYYRLANPVTGRLRVAVESRGGDVGVSIVGAGPDGGCDLAGSCQAHVVAAADPTIAELDAEQGDVLYLVVSGRPGQAPSFTLDVVCDKRWLDDVID